MSLPQKIIPLPGSSTALEKAERSYVTFHVEHQLFGIAVEQVQDVLRRQRLTPIPLAPREVVGAVNLRGRVVTALNMREKLGLPFSKDLSNSMNIVVDHRGELFSLWVDSVGDVMTLSLEDFDKIPPNLDDKWQQFADGGFQLEDGLLLILNVPALIGI